MAKPLGRYLAQTATYRTLLLEALVVTAACAVLALFFNALRSNGIPLVQKTEYEILVPCPETTGEVDSFAPDILDEDSQEALFVDARPKAAFDGWHLQEARNITYDYLEPVSLDELRSIVSSGAKRVIVYGDGADPDSGEHLARELSGKGIRNVGFIVGGAPALMTSLREGGQP